MAPLAGEALQHGPKWQLQPAVSFLMPLFCAVALARKNFAELADSRFPGFSRTSADIGDLILCAVARSGVDNSERPFCLQHCIWPDGAAASVSAVGRRLEERRSGGYAQLGAALGAAPEPRERKARQPRQIPIASVLKVKKKNNSKKNNKNTTATA